MKTDIIYVCFDILYSGNSVKYIYCMLCVAVTFLVQSPEYLWLTFDDENAYDDNTSWTITGPQPVLDVGSVSSGCMAASRFTWFVYSLCIGCNAISHFISEPFYDFHHFIKIVASSSQQRSLPIVLRESKIYREPTNFHSFHNVLDQQ